MSARRRKRNKSTASNPPAGESQETAVLKPPQPMLSRRRKWLFRLTAMVLAPALFLTLLEAGLRLAGYGYPTTFFVGPDADGTYANNTRFGWRFFPRALARKSDPCSVSAKPSGAIRIFILGSSAAQGMPSSSVSFGRILEVMLRDRYPGVPFEVINAAMTAINSHVILEIARDCAAHQPDLFAVYMGNNEVVGPYGPGTIFQRWSPSLKFIRANTWVKSTRIGQLLDNAIHCFQAKDETPASWRGMEMFMDHQVASDDPRLEVVYDNFRRNLLDLCWIAHRAGAAVILSTVAVNLRDCPPLASRHRSGLSPEELTKWKSIYQAGVDLEASIRQREALEQYEAAARIDDRFAELQFRLGRCLAAEGRFAEARDRFVLARDLDVLRFRADSRINAIIREVAAEEKRLGVRGVDAEKTLADSDLASDGILGGDLFYEHVHFTFDGNYLLARTFMDQIEAALPQLAAFRKQGSVLSRQQCAESLTLTPWDEYQMAKLMTEVTSLPPFTNQLDHALREASSREQMANLGKRALAPQALDEACNRYEAALEKTPDNWDLHYRYGTLALAMGKFEIAANHFRIVQKKLPWEFAVYVNFGHALQDCGQVKEAIACYQKSLDLNPSDPTTCNSLGGAMNKLGRIDEAIACFQKALDIDPKSARAHKNLGAVMFNRGKTDEAIAHFQKALEIDPLDSTTHNDLGKILSGVGRIDEAIVHFQEALKIDPSNAKTRDDLEKALKKRAARVGCVIARTRFRGKT